jgi:hypothetical protein
MILSYQVIINEVFCLGNYINLIILQKCHLYKLKQCQKMFLLQKHFVFVKLGKSFSLRRHCERFL